MKISVKLAMVMAIVATILMPLLTRSQVYADPNCSASKTLNVVAHTDDDLLFINPDIQDDIRGKDRHIGTKCIYKLLPCITGSSI